MVELDMVSNYLYRNKSISENIHNKQLPSHLQVIRKHNVDINRLLNRVRLNKKIEIKKTVFFLSLTISSLSIFGMLIMIAR